MQPDLLMSLSPALLEATSSLLLVSAQSTGVLCARRCHCGRVSPFPDSSLIHLHAVILSLKLGWA